MNKTLVLNALAENATVISLDEVELPTPTEWNLFNLSGYDVRHVGNFLIFDEDSASQLEDILHHGARNNNNLTLDERVEFGRNNQSYFRQKLLEDIEACGDPCPVCAVKTFGYWEHNNLKPTQFDIIEALAGVGRYAENMAELYTLGALEDLARRYFDCVPTVDAEDLEA